MGSNIVHLHRPGKPSPEIIVRTAQTGCAKMSQMTDDPDLPGEISERLKRVRIARGYKSAAQAARQLRLSPTYSQHENGTRNPGRQALMMYARRFRTSPEWLEYGTGGMFGGPAGLIDVSGAVFGDGTVRLFDIEPELTRLFSDEMRSVPPPAGATPGTLAFRSVTAGYEGDWTYYVNMDTPPDRVEDIKGALCLVQVPGEKNHRLAYAAPTRGEDSEVMLFHPNRKIETHKIEWARLVVWIRPH